MRSNLRLATGAIDGASADASRRSSLVLASPGDRRGSLTGALPSPDRRGSLTGALPLPDRRGSLSGALPSPDRRGSLTMALPPEPEPPPPPPEPEGPLSAREQRRRRFQQLLAEEQRRTNAAVTKICRIKLGLPDPDAALAPKAAVCKEPTGTKVKVSLRSLGLFTTVLQSAREKAEKLEKEKKEKEQKERQLAAENSNGSVASFAGGSGRRGPRRSSGSEAMRRAQEKVFGARRPSIALNSVDLMTPRRGSVTPEALAALKVQQEAYCA